jgi:hypothetical protein
MKHSPLLRQSSFVQIEPHGTNETASIPAATWFGPQHPGLPRHLPQCPFACLLIHLEGKHHVLAVPTPSEQTKHVVV